MDGGRSLVDESVEFVCSGLWTVVIRAGCRRWYTMETFHILLEVGVALHV